VVIVAPIAPYMQAISGERAEIINLLKPGQDPHHMALSPSQAQAIATADALIIPDHSISPAIMGYAQKYPQLKVIELSALPGAEPLPYAHENPWVSSVKEHDPEGGADEVMDMPALKAAPNPRFKHLAEFNAKPSAATEKPEVTDPHLWLDPLRMANLLPALAQELGEVWPEAAPTFQKNATRIALHLRAEVQPGIANLLSEARMRNRDDSKTIPFMTYHDAYQYFQARYGLTAGYITQRPEEYMGAKTLQQLLAKAKVSEVRCLISETDSTSVKRLAELSKAQIKTLNPERSYQASEVPLIPWAKNDYDRMLLAVTKTFAECM
jgi:zinc transport system substrate-binding protein